MKIRYKKEFRFQPIPQQQPLLQDSISNNPRKNHLRNRLKNLRVTALCVHTINMAEERDNIIRWLEGRPLPGAPRNPAPTNADEAISQPFFQGVNTSDPAASPVDVYKNPRNHVDATSSILTYAGNAADFHPATQDITQTAKQYDAYITKVSSFPGFVLKFNEQSHSYQTSVNIDSMISDIKNAYDGVLAVDINKIVESVERMANTVLSQSTSDESRSLFSQAAVTKASDSTLVEVSIFYTTFHMKKSQSGKKTYLEQSYNINRTVFSVITSVLTANAEKFAEKILKAPIDDWLNSNSSPTDSKSMSCFEQHFRGKEI
ncbi:hypothetical protein EDD11_008978 [Mortierella claussenii]|nr:hypothetical protein EDD11_008978 [Mortierella claussenii]